MKSQLTRRVDSAQRDADMARQRVLGTLGEIRKRLDPRVLASEAAQDAFTGMNRLLDDATESAKARPWLIGIGATMLGLLLTLGAKFAAGKSDGETDEPTKPTPSGES